MSTLRLVNAAQGLGLEINVRDVFQYSTLKEMSASANLRNLSTDNDSLKKQPLFEVSKQLVDNKLNPFDVLPMQRAYWMGQMFVQAAERDGASNTEEAERLYSPHVYMEYEVVIYKGTTKVSGDSRKNYRGFAKTTRDTTCRHDS